MSRCPREQPRSASRRAPVEVGKSGDPCLAGGLQEVPAGAADSGPVITVPLSRPCYALSPFRTDRNIRDSPPETLSTACALGGHRGARTDTPYLRSPGRTRCGVSAFEMARADFRLRRRASVSRSPRQTPGLDEIRQSSRVPSGSRIPREARVSTLAIQPCAGARRSAPGSTPALSSRPETV